MAAGSITLTRAFVVIDALDRTGKVFTSLSNRIAGFAARMSMIGAQITAVSMAPAFALRKITNDYVRFEDKMLEVKAVTRATRAEYEHLSDAARKMGRAVTFSTQEVAEAMAELGRAGFGVDRIEKSMSAVLDLARASRLELQEAATFMGATLQTFNIDASSAGGERLASRVADLLTATAASSATSVPDLMEAIKYSAPLAVRVGMPMENYMQMLGSLGNVGMRGSIAGTSVRKLLERMALPKTVKEFEKFGVKYLDEQGHILDPQLALAQFVSEMTKRGMGANEQLAKLKNLFGIYGLSGIAAMANSYSFDKDGKGTFRFPELSKAIQESNGLAHQLAKEMDSGLGGSIRLLIAAIQEVSIAIGATLAPMMKMAAGQAQIFANVFSVWSSANPELVAGLTAGIGGLLTLGLTVTALSIAAFPVVSVLGMVIGMFSSLFSTIAAGVPVMAWVIGEAAKSFSGGWNYVKTDMYNAAARYQQEIAKSSAASKYRKTMGEAGTLFNSAESARKAEYAKSFEEIRKEFISARTANIGTHTMELARIDQERKVFESVARRTRAQEGFMKISQFQRGAIAARSNVVAVIAEYNKKTPELLKKENDAYNVLMKNLETERRLVRQSARGGTRIREDMGWMRVGSLDGPAQRPLTSIPSGNLYTPEEKVYHSHAKAATKKHISALTKINNEDAAARGKALADSQKANQALEDSRKRINASQKKKLDKDLARIANTSARETDLENKRYRSEEKRILGEARGKEKNARTALLSSEKENKRMFNRVSRQASSALAAERTAAERNNRLRAQSAAVWNLGGRNWGLSESRIGKPFAKAWESVKKAVYAGSRAVPTNAENFTLHMNQAYAYFRNGLLRISKAVRSVGSGLSAFWNNLSMGGKAVYFFSNGIRGFSAVMKFGWGMIRSSWLAIIEVIVRAIHQGNLWKEALGALVVIMVAAGAGIYAFLKTFDLVIRGFAQLLSWAMQAANALLKLVGIDLGKIGDAFWKPIARLFSGLWSTLSDAIGTVIEMLRAGNVSGAMTYLGLAADEMKLHFKMAWADLKDAFSEHFGWLKKWYNKIGIVVTEFVAKTWGRIDGDLAVKAYYIQEGMISSLNEAASRYKLLPYAKAQREKEFKEESERIAKAKEREKIRNDAMVSWNEGGKIKAIQKKAKELSSQWNFTESALERILTNYSNVMGFRTEEEFIKGTWKFASDENFFETFRRNVQKTLDDGTAKNPQDAKAFLDNLNAVFDPNANLVNIAEDGSLVSEAKAVEEGAYSQSVADIAKKDAGFNARLANWLEGVKKGTETRTLDQFLRAEANNFETLSKTARHGLAGEEGTRSQYASFAGSLRTILSEREAKRKEKGFMENNYYSNEIKKIDKELEQVRQGQNITEFAEMAFVKAQTIEAKRLEMEIQEQGRRQKLFDKEQELLKKREEMEKKKEGFLEAIKENVGNIADYLNNKNEVEVVVN